MNDYSEMFTDIWSKYEKSRDYIQSKNLMQKTERNWRFFVGDQWYGLESGGEELPKLNFIKPICKYKIATVAQHSMVANYTDMENREETVKVCELLNKKFAKSWEKGKNESFAWKVIKAACIQGDSYIFYGTADTDKPQLLINTNVLLADEQNPDLQEQKYIMIYERLSSEDIREEARKNHIDASEIETIMSDEETEYNLMNREEVKESGKCTSILFLTKKDNIVHIAKSTKTCIYMPLTPIAVTDSEGNTVGGLKSYPIVNMVWEEYPNSARGISEVEQYIPNQIEVNKTYARRSIAVKMFAFPKMAYNENQVSNPDDLDKVGAKIAVNGEAGIINKAIAYLNPTGTAVDAKNLSDDLIGNTKDLAGAGDAATGIINPEQASGTAINAVRDQAALPLNEQVATYKQFVENLANLWIDIWTTYNPNGFDVTYEDEGETITERITSEELENLKLDVRIDISPDNPWTKYAEQQELANLFAGGHITLEEYIEASSENSPLPKNKLKRILAKRSPEIAPQQIADNQENNPGMETIIQGMEGGGEYDMPELQ